MTVCYISANVCMDMSRVIPHTLDRTQSVCLQQSLSAHSSLSLCRCRHSHSLNNCKLTKRKMLSSFLLAHASGTRKMITGGFTTHVVARSTTMVSSKLYNTCGRLEEYQEHEAVWDIWSISMHLGDESRSTTMDTCDDHTNHKRGWIQYYESRKVQEAM